MTALRTTTNKNKYNAKTYDGTYIRLKKDGSDGYTMDEVKAAAEAEGKSVNAFVVEAIREKMNNRV